MRSARLVLGWMLALVAIASGCARDETPPSEEGVSSASPAPTLEVPSVPERSSDLARRSELAQRLRALHLAADEAAGTEEKEHAAEELLEVFHETKDESSPHLQSVRQDLAARAAALLVDASPERAKAAAEAGIALSEAPSILRANLFMALADAEEALGHESEAKKALFAALTINEELFESEMKSP